MCTKDTFKDPQKIFNSTSNHLFTARVLAGYRPPPVNKVKCFPEHSRNDDSVYELRLQESGKRTQSLKDRRTTGTPPPGSAT